MSSSGAFFKHLGTRSLHHTMLVQQRDRDRSLVVVGLNELPQRHQHITPAVFFDAIVDDIDEAPVLPQVRPSASKR